MIYEKGKTYQFTNKQFNVGRDGNNRLMFIVPDPATGGEYRIVAFDYQNANIPERITCIYNGHKFEQDPLSAAVQLYKPGDIVSFYVNSDVRLGRCTLRDEKNDVTYKNLKVGKAKLKRFDRVDCRIEEVSAENLSITPLTDDEKRAEAGFTAQDVAGMPEGRYLRFNILEKLLEHPGFREARELLEAGDNRWVVVFLEEGLAQTVDLIRRRRLHQDYILSGLESMAVALIERTDYVSKLSAEQQAEIERRLEAVASSAADYRRVYNLLQCHEVDSMMHAILGSLKRSIRFYQPEEKVRLLDAMITLEAVDVQRYMETVLDIISDHHGNSTFMQYFKQGMLRILARFITMRQEEDISTDRNALRLMIRALATEQLLSAGTQDDIIARRRGLLYTCAAILINDCDNDLPAKAIQCFAGLVTAPPEFSWTDLRDVQRLCYAYLTQPFKSSDMVNASAQAEFKGRLIAVSPEYITVASDSSNRSLRRTLSYPLSPGMALEFYTDDRIPGFNADTCMDNPVLQKNGFQDLIRLLGNSGHITSASKPQNLRLEEGDHVHICVTGRKDANYYSCRIIDSAYSGSGIIGERDIVAYDINSRIEDFRHDGKMMIFDAMVKGVQADGSYLFSVRPAMNSYGLQQATYDYDSENEVQCIITGYYKGRGYYALSQSGYPMVVWLPEETDFELHRNDIVTAIVTSVNSDNGNLYVKGTFTELIIPDDERFEEENPLTVEDIYREALQGISLGECEEELEELPADGNIPEGPALELQSENVRWILKTICHMAFIGQQQLGRRYSLMMVCRVISELASPASETKSYALQAAALEELGSFAATSRVDMPRLRNLRQEAAQSNCGDLSLSVIFELLRILAALDRPEEFTPGDYSTNQALDKTCRMVSAYNQLQGMSLESARREILKGIYDTLNLPMPKTIDVEALKVQEDERNEFKTSLIYPADNKMHADEFRQGRVIMEVVDGMLNHKGGVIYLGVNNQGVPSGLDNDFRFLNNNSDKYDLRDIQDKFSLHFHYYLRTQIGMSVDGRTVTDYVKLVFDELGGKMTARVIVEPFPGIVRMRDGKVFQRQDSSTIALRQSEQAAVALRRRGEG